MSNATRFVQRKFIKDGDWKESEHPRASDGKFGSGGSSSGRKETKRQYESLDGSAGYKNYLEENYPKIESSASSAQKKALMIYTGDAFSKVNANVVSGRKDEIIDGIQSWIEKNKLRGDLNLYRGLILDELPEPGMILKSKGFSSFSSSNKIANRFASNSQGKHQVILELKADEGSPIAPINGHSQAGSDEKEFIAKNDLSYKILNKRKEGERWIYEISLV